MAVSAVLHPCRCSPRIVSECSVYRWKAKAIEEMHGGGGTEGDYTELDARKSSSRSNESVRSVRLTSRLHSMLILYHS